MYQMYAYDETAAPGAQATARSGESGAAFTAALQFALDRRDNGGDAQGRPQ